MALLFAHGVLVHSRIVAVVDDDESVLRSLQDLIESDGLSTLCFGSAELFLTSDAWNQAACLIADIRMPGMSGLEPQAKLKTERCQIPIIFITAHRDAEMRLHAMRERAVEFFSKPFDDAVGGPDGAAARLGLNRTTLISRMKKHGIFRPPAQA